MFRLILRLCYWILESWSQWDYLVPLSLSVLWSDLLYGKTLVWIWRSTFPVLISKAWWKYVLFSQMVVAMATLKSPTVPYLPAPPLRQAALGSGMTGYVGTYYSHKKVMLMIKHYKVIFSPTVPLHTTTLWRLISSRYSQQLLGCLTAENVSTNQTYVLLPS